MSLLKCRDLAFSYDGKEVLSGINFKIEQGDYLCIVGENGAGKSTLIKGLLGLKKASSGTIEMGEGLKPDAIGYLPQQNIAQKDFPASVEEIVISGRLNSLGKKLFYSNEDRRMAHRRMQALGIMGLRKKCYRELSGGLQQRVLLSRALCATKQLLLLDEPVTGLDPVVSQEFYELIRKLNKEENISVIMVSHDVEYAIRDASHVLHLGNAQIFFGTTEEYKKSEYGIRFLEGRDKRDQ